MIRPCGITKNYFAQNIFSLPCSYGDRTPMSQLGRIFAVGWVLVGLVIISVMMGALTTALTTITSVSDTTIYGSKVRES